MTLEEARSLIPERELPEFWVGKVEGLSARWEALQQAEVRIAALSPGGRPIHRIAFGSHEPVPRLANFNSAVGAREEAAFADRARREKPVVFFIGPVHGQETEALTGLASLVAVMETGRDLAGRPQRRLRELGERCRLLIIPVGNPDGVARFEPQTSRGLTGKESAFWGMGTWADATIAHWPTSKRIHPMVGEEVGFLGCYFNDIGVNPMHDEFFEPLSTEAPAILRIAREEAPDLAVSLHSHESATAILRPAYVPLEVQQEVRELAERYYPKLDAAGLPRQKHLFDPRAERGTHPASLNLTSAVYHTSGATTFTFESPRGISDADHGRLSLLQLLDIQLLLYEAMLEHALERHARRP